MPTFEIMGAGIMFYPGGAWGRPVMSGEASGLAFFWGEGDGTAWAYPLETPYENRGGDWVAEGAPIPPGLPSTSWNDVGFFPSLVLQGQNGWFLMGDGPLGLYLRIPFVGNVNLGLGYMGAWADSQHQTSFFNVARNSIIWCGSRFEYDGEGGAYGGSKLYETDAGTGDTDELIDIRSWTPEGESTFHGFPFAVTPDGAVWVVSPGVSNQGVLWRRSPEGSWGALDFEWGSRDNNIAALPNNNILVRGPGDVPGELTPLSNFTEITDPDGLFAATLMTENGANAGRTSITSSVDSTLHFVSYYTVEDYPGLNYFVIRVGDDTPTPGGSQVPTLRRLGPNQNNPTSMQYSLRRGWYNTYL